jgi:hypothetical protein
MLLVLVAFFEIDLAFTGFFFSSFTSLFLSFFLTDLSLSIRGLLSSIGRFLSTSSIFSLGFSTFGCSLSFISSLFLKIVLIAVEFELFSSNAVLFSSVTSVLFSSVTSVSFSSVASITVTLLLVHLHTSAFLSLLP